VISLHPNLFLPANIPARVKVAVMSRGYFSTLVNSFFLSKENNCVVIGGDWDYDLVIELVEITGRFPHYKVVLKVSVTK